VKREKIEWCDMRWFNADNDSLPGVLLIGDSIAVGYSAKVQEQLDGTANVARLATSKCLCDKALLKELGYAFWEYRYEVVHFNNGLHGWSFTEEDYASSFPAFFEHLRKLAKNAALIWANSTPVRCRDNREQLDAERNQRVIARNRIARQFLSEHNVITNDLYGLMVGHPELCTDGVHYNNDGYKIMADAVCKCILSQCQCIASWDAESM
jgi:hypothetical protein